jgi:hypothetical protein
MKSTITVFLLFCTVVFWSATSPNVMAVNQGSWTQKTQQDFQSDSTTNLDTTTSPGSVQLSQLPPFSIGNSPIDRRGGNATGADTYITGSVAPVSGSIVAYRFYTNAGCSQGGFICCFFSCPNYNFQLDVFRNNGSYYKLVGQSSMGLAYYGDNEISLSPAINVKQGDVLGFYLDSALLVPYDDAAGSTSLKISGQVTSDTSTSSWSCAFMGSFFCTTVNFSVQADIVPNAIGTLTSIVRDTNGTTTWGKMFWNSTGTGSVTFSTRSSLDTITWTPWATATNNSAVTSASGRFLQFRALFNGSASVALTPALHSVSVSYATNPPAAPAQPSFLQTYSAWIILAAVVAGFGVAIFLTRPKTPKAG